MVRVLHIVGKMHRGGIETLLMEVYRNLNRDKVQFDFLCFTHEEGFYDQEIYSLGGRIFYASSRREGIRKNEKDIFEIFRSHPEIQIIHHHMSSCSYIAPLVIAKKTGIKTRIAHSHNTYCAGRLRNILHNINKYRLPFYATDYFACSNDAGKWMFLTKYWKYGNILKNGIESSKYVFNMQKRLQMRKKLNLTDNFVIGFVGRFAEQKNMMFICEIFKRICEKHKNDKLLLVGEGSMHNAMVQYFENAKLAEKVIYTGVVENVQDYLQAMDVFVLPSLFEGLGIVAIEAQAAGLNTLLSDRIPKEAFITNLAYALPIDKGVELWVNKIEELKRENSLRENTEEKIIRAGYDVSESAAFLEKYYLNCIESRG